MRPRWFLVLAALRVITAGYAADAAPAPAHPALAGPAIDWNELDRTTITVDPHREIMVMELPPVDLAAGTVVEEPASVGEFPVTGSIYALHAELVDAEGRRLPTELLHHMNVMDPNERELFLPISRRILASGMETGEIRFPWLLFGSRVHAGQRILANAMVHNPTHEDYKGVRVQLIISYVPEHRPWPFFSVLPWQLDVGFPVGDKSFDLPPGHTERSYEGSPGVEGKLVVIGGHMHPYGKTIEFWDATTGTLLWHGEPAPAPAGVASAVPIAKLYTLTSIGLHITPSHRYRVRVIYDNPTGQTIVNGGMGVVGGLFVPARGVTWPATDPSDSLYQQDLRHFMGAVGKPAVAMPMAEMHMEH
jgi:hypothetical protein